MKKVSEEAKKKLPLWSKISISIGVLIVLFTAFFLIIDTPAVSRYKQFVWERMNILLNDSQRTETSYMRVVESVEFAEIEEEIPFKVPKPIWLPEEYELDYIDYHKSDDIYTIKYKYINKDNDTYYTEFSISTYVISNPEVNILVDYEKVKVRDLEIILMSFGNPIWQANYVNEQGLEILISTLEDKETLLKIIENMS